MDVSKIKKLKQGKGDGGDSKPKLRAEEKGALEKLRKEAKQYGATLHNNGEGSLPPSLVLGVMRRDRFQCKISGDKDDLAVHHVAHLKHPSKGAMDKDPEGRSARDLITISARAHDKIHKADEADDLNKPNTEKDDSNS